MKLRDIAITAFAILLVGLLGFLWFSPSGMQAAPQLSMTSLDGRQFSLQQLRGKPVMVVFWATTCPGCIKEMPHLVELYKEYHPRGLELIGIAMEYDPPEQVMELVTLRRLPYPIVLDSKGEAARAFGDVKLTPTSFLIDPNGQIVQQRLGEMDFDQLKARIRGML